MRWKVQLIAETDSGERIEEEIVTLGREDLLSPATVRLSIAEEESEVALDFTKVLHTSPSSHAPDLPYSPAKWIPRRWR